MKLKIYVLSQTENRGYDTYNAIVVCAKDRKSAKNIHPSNNWDTVADSWCSSPDKVTVEYIGIAKKGMKEGIILCSFNAG